MDRVAIIDGGRLARIRITVYDIIPYLEAGRSPNYIAAILTLSTDEVLALMRYIEEHKEEVMAVHRRIEERIARGNPPEVEAMRKESHAKLLALKAELEQRQASETRESEAIGGCTCPDRPYARFGYNAEAAQLLKRDMDRVAIIDRGRGPELARIRITVYDIIPYLEAGRSPNFIAAVLNLSTAEVLALMRYIEEHKEEVMAVHRRIEERIARGNPPEVEAKLKASYPKFLALKAELAEQAAREREAKGASDPR